MTRHRSAQATARAHAHLLLRRRARRDRRPERRPHRADRLQRRVDPPAHRHHHAHARAPTGRRAIDLAARCRGARRSRGPGVDPTQIDAVIVATISNVQQTPSCRRHRRRPHRREPRSGLRPERRVRRLRLRRRAGGRPHPRGRRPLRRSSSARRSSATSSIRPTAASRSCWATARAPSSIGPSDSPASRPTVWGSDGSKADAVGMNDTSTEFRDGEARGRRAAPGGPDGLPLGGLGDGEGRQAGARGGRASTASTTSPRSSRTRPTCASSTSSPSSSKLPDTVVIGRDIETTGNTSAASIPLATHRLLEEHPELSGGLALQIGFGAGLVFGAQVVVLP